MNPPAIKPTRWTRWLARIGCSTHELVELMHRWEKKEESEIRHILLGMGHRREHIEDAIKQILPKNTSFHPKSKKQINDQSTMDDNDHKTNQGLLSTLEHLIQRLTTKGQTDLGQLAHQLKQAGFKASEISQGLANGYHAGVGDIVKALHKAEFTLHEISSSLQKDWKMGSEGIVKALKTVEGDAHKVMAIVKKDFDLGKDEVHQILEEIYQFPNHEIHRIQHQLGLLEHKIENKIDHAKHSIEHVAHHVLNPLNWFHKEPMVDANPTNVHAFVQAIGQNDELQLKLSHLKEGFVNSVVGLAYEAGFHLNKAELAAALPGAGATKHLDIPHTHRQQDHTQQTQQDHKQQKAHHDPNKTLGGMIIGTYQKKTLITSARQAKLHALILEACKNTEMELKDGKIEPNAVYLHLAYPKDLDLGSLTEELCSETSDGMIKAYPDLKAELDDYGFWADNLQVLSDLSSTNIETKMATLTSLKPASFL
ncbi:MAG: transposase [Bacteroidota bacterium]